MKSGPPGAFAAQLKSLREAAGFTQEELATIAGLSVHAVSALERGERRRPHAETVRALSAALDLTGAGREALVRSARAPVHGSAVAELSDELSGASLPLALTALVGREADMLALRHWFADRTARLMTLTGPGGSGKTRLALELARTIQSEGGSRALFVPLAAIRNPSLVAAAIAEALGLSDATVLDLPRRARISCGDQPMLLVLDNFEQVLDAAPLVAELLTSVASLRVVATSRAPLRVRGEREHAVGPLALEDGPDVMPPADLSRAPAVRLFLERVRDVQPDFKLTAVNRPAVSAICRRLDALPLALELAAPWMKVLTVENLLQRLAQDVLLSAAGPRDLPERQQTINATVAWSYQLLEPAEQRAFRRFGALPGLFPIDAAAAVLGGRDSASAPTDEALGWVAALMDKSLLVRSPTSAVVTCPLYQMLETVRAYAALQLTAAGERDEAMEGLVRYTTTEAALATEGLVGPAQVDWLDRVREDLESYRAALTFLIDRGRSVEASVIAWGLLFFWVIRGHAAEGLGWYEQILNLPSVPAVVESRALVGSGAMRFTLGELQPARTALVRALALDRGAGDPLALAQGEDVLGHVEHAEGRTDAAREHFWRAIAAFKAVPNPWGVGHSLSGLALVALAVGDAAETERLLDEGSAALHDSGPWFASLGQYVRAVLAVRRGQAESAIAVVRESLTQIRQLHDRFAFVYALVPLAAAAILKGDDVWAARILGVRAAVTERTGATFVDPSARDLTEQAEGEVRARLGPERWAQAFAAGRGMTIDSLLKDIDGR